MFYLILQQLSNYFEQFFKLYTLQNTVNLKLNDIECICDFLNAYYLLRRKTPIQETKRT